MPTSHLKEVYSMLAEWETQAKELAQNEFLSEANAKLEERAKQLFEGIAFDQLGEEVEEDETVDTSATEAVTPLDAELSLGTGEAPMDEPLPTETTVDGSAEFGWDEPAVSVAKDGNDDTVITIDAASLSAAAGNPDSAPAAAGECTCPIHGNGNAATAGLEGEPEIKPDNEVIDMTQEPDMDAILESFIALSENADENQVEIVSENCDSEMEELTEEELAELDESMDTDSMMKALQEAFMGVHSGTGFVQEGREEDEDDDDDDDWDDDQAEAVKNAKKGRKLDVGDLDESCKEDLEEGDNARNYVARLQNLAASDRRANDKDNSKKMADSGRTERKHHVTQVRLQNHSTNGSILPEEEDLEEGMNDNSRARAAQMQNTAAIHRKNAGNASSADGKDASAGFAKDSIAASKSGRNNEFKGKAPMQKLAEEELEEGCDELDEASQRTLANGKNQTLKPNTFPKERKRSGLSESQNLLMKLSKKVEAVLAENARLKSENKEMATLNEGLETKFTAATDKLQEVKGKLYEASIIASKSTCMNKLMLEHVTTQDEKINIVESFQKAASRAEVQNLFEKFDKSFKKGATVQLNEGKNLFSKLNPLFKSETNNQEVLNEGAAYDNAFTARMNQLIQHNGKK